MSNYSDFDDSPPPSPPPEQESQLESFDEDFPPPDDDDDEMSAPETFDEGSSLPPPSEDMESDAPDDDFPPFEDEISDAFSEDIPESTVPESLDDSQTPSLPPSTISEPPPSDFSDAPQTAGKDKFLLPVKALKVPISVSERVEAASDADLDSLSSGLMIRKVPPIVKPATVVDDTPSSVERLAPKPVAPQIQYDSARASPQALEPAVSSTFQADEASEGFSWCMGKFEGDPFEKLQVALQGNTLLVRVATGETIDFDLSEKSFVFEDTAEPRTLILDYNKTPILLKFFSDDEFIQFMKALPEVVFISPDDAEEEKEPLPVAPEKKRNAPSVGASSTKAQPKLQNQHVKGTSVEDLLENDFDAPVVDRTNAGPAAMNQVSVPSGPPRKRELATSHIRRPKYSVRRVALLCEWINSLHIWPNLVSVLTLHKEMVNGVLLARLVKSLNPEVQFVHLNEKALAKKAAVENLEQALGHIWRSKSLNNSRIPSAEEIYSGDASKIAILLNELFGVYVQRPLFKSSMKILRWLHHILKQYQRPLPPYVVDEGDLAGLWPHFQSGTALFCILYHFFGTTSIGKGHDERRLDPLKIAGDPKSLCDFRDNLLYVFDSFRLIGVEILWTPEDWITNPDTEFILLQLSLIYDRLKLMQCALPPAQGDRPGLASGPNGEALVVGLVFNDAPSSLKFVARSRKAVRLGSDKDSMPLLPIEQVTQNKRFFRHGFLPRGMITKDARVGFVGLKLKEAKLYVERGDWNGRTTIRTEKESFAGNDVVTLLRSQHRQERDERDDSSKAPGKTQVADFGSGTRRVSAASDGIVESKDPAAFSFDEMGKDIASLIKALEEEMLAAQRDIQLAEDALASRYLDLEASASSYSAEEYSRSLDQLESDRVDLEQEKERLKDYFARKLALIKERKEEVHRKALDFKKSSLQAVQPQESEADKGKSKAALTKRTAKPSASSHKDVKQAEKGWIKLSSKMSTHNFHLRVKQDASTAAFQAKITPKRLLERQAADKGETAAFAVDDASRGAGASLLHLKDKARANMTPEEALADSFHRFKDRLRVVSEKWLLSRNMKTRSVVQEIIQSGVKNPTVELISLPDKALHGSGQGFVHMPTSAQSHSSPRLRQEELAAMYYEDERRKMVLSEQDILRSHLQTQNLFSSAAIAAPTSPPGPGSPSGPKHASHMGPFNPSDFEKILRLLAQPQVLTLVGRNSREMLFELIEMDDDAVHVRLGSLAWSWRSPYGADEDVAFVLLSDVVGVASVPSDELAFSLQIAETTKALKNSKGRTNLCLRCETKADCERLFYSFSFLVHMHTSA